MKPLNLFAVAILCQLPAMGAVSLDAKDDSSVLQASDPALKDLGKTDTTAPAGKADEAFAAGEFDEAVRLATPRAEAGDADAIYLLGFASETGKGLPQSRERALGYYRQGAAKGHADSIYRLAINLASTGAAADSREAQALLEKQAEKDVAVSGRILGELFLRGRFTEKPDAETGVSWWKKASAAGDVASMNFLAAFYEGQMGFPEKMEPELTLQYYGAAAAKGDTSAMVNLGSRLLTGDEKLRDEKKGKEWIAKAIAEKDASGYLALGIYQEGVKKDEKAALAEYEKGAAAGQVDSMIRAAGMYANGKGAEKNEEKATELLEVAAEKGSAQAHLELAGMILNKEKPDLAKGYSHLLTAANGGLAFAQNELGIFYLSGKLGVADLSAAVSWFGRAAQSNFAPAQNNLATLHERGAGVPQNFENALQLYTLAAQQGHPGATLAIARLNAAGAGTKQNLEIAWALATIAGERGEENAAAFIEEVEKNLTKEQLAGAKKELERLNPGKAGE
ncbi:SEL1-like repeat protein [Akkermansiaceae bacterium]|nr:SEL1-like repeat protein [Akkermansiaceae bacterium]